jgi:hypothetical protein
MEQNKDEEVKKSSFLIERINKIRIWKRIVMMKNTLT